MPTSLTRTAWTSRKAAALRARFEDAELKRAEYMWEIAQLHARNGVDVMKGGGTEKERKEMRWS